MNSYSERGSGGEGGERRSVRESLLIFFFLLVLPLQAQPLEPDTASLVPLPGEMTPAITEKTTLLMTTGLGKVTIEVYPQAAPHAVSRFLELVESGFYDDTPVSRVVQGFVAQFGINWREPHRAWKEKSFDDDPTYFALQRGTLAFAKAGLNGNSTQVFINLRDNSYLADPEYNFTVFGKVVDGMEVVEQFAMVGDPKGGLNQERLWTNGQDYLDSLRMKPTMIQSLRVKKEGGNDAKEEGI